MTELTREAVHKMVVELLDSAVGKITEATAIALKQALDQHREAMLQLFDEQRELVRLHTIEIVKAELAERMAQADGGVVDLAQRRAR